MGVNQNILLLLQPIPERGSAQSRFTEGEMPEWSIGAVSKTVVPVWVPRVRIPLSPQTLQSRHQKRWRLFFMQITIRHDHNPLCTSDFHAARAQHARYGKRGMVIPRTVLLKQGTEKVSEKI